MKTRLPVVTTDDTVEKCMKIMRQHSVRFLPVFDGFDFKGVISTDDIIYEVVKNRMDVFDPEDDHSYTFAWLLYNDFIDDSLTKGFIYPLDDLFFLKNKFLF